MFDIPTASTALHHFVARHSEALQNAAMLLGGLPWLRRVQATIERLQYGASVGCVRSSDFQALHELLTLHHVHDAQRPEAAYFARLDPAAPYVEDICVLADELQEAINATEFSTRNSGTGRRGEAKDG